MTEVSLDAAVSMAQTKLSAQTTEILDGLIVQAVDLLQKDNLSPIESVLCYLTTKEVPSLLDQKVSVVECFRYLFVTAERIIIGGDDLGVDEEAATVECSKDFAASYLRLGDKTEDLIPIIEEKLNRSDMDLSDKLQAQCDLTFCHAKNRNVEQLNQSLVKEIDLLLQVQDYQKAYMKIIKFKLFGPGLRLFSSHVARVDLLNFEDVFTSRKKVFEKYLDFLDELGGGLSSEVEKDREQADIIVNLKGKKGFINGKFFVNDLASGLRIAQNKGGTIFLESGDYHADNFHQVKLKSSEKTLEIIGSSTNECSIHGTLKIHSENKIIFRRLKLEIGDSAESREAIYLTAGSAVFDCCLIESTVNSLFYSLQGTELRLVRCILDGLESCQRGLSVAGTGVRLEVEDCWCRDLLSLITLLENEPVREVTVRITGCELEGVQSVVSATVDSISSVILEESNLSLVLYDQDVESVAVKVAAGEKLAQSAVRSNNNYINFSHIDGRGFDLKNIRTVDLTRTLILTDETIDRKLAICEAVTSECVDTLSLENIFIRGFRLGLNVKITKNICLRLCSVERCSIGLNISQHPGCNRVLVQDCQFSTIYYGIFGQDTEAKLHLVDTKFLDIPKPLLLCREIIAGFVEESCQYLLTREYTTAQDFNTLEKELNLYLATSENLPHRIAYEREDVQLLYNYDRLGFSNE